ncbi:MAG TPA: flagellar biosynthesis protein FliQ [Sphingomonas sp.]|jgi:flagellar biosynthetic protein FliQ|uniref:flagellar biosynthesis protein FliQ n=1 Tax=Sphingomonas sp. TaxID=28214 RepID=UPI002EDAC600
MTGTDVIEIARAALVVVLTVCGPLLATSLIVGLVVSLVQAVTQIQEQTLTFVPKVLSMGIVLLMTLPMMGHALADFTHLISDKIIAG